MLRTILAALDGSVCAANAVELGVRWADRFGALLVGLGIVDRASVCPPELVPIGAGAYKEHRDATLLARARREVEGFLGTFAVRCADAGVPSKVLEDEGEPYDRLLTEAQRYDLILLGQETRDPLATKDHAREGLHGVLKNTPRPVVLVPRALPAGDAAVVAYDGSLPAARALQALEALGFAASRAVHVVTVSTSHEEAVRHAERAMDFLAHHEVKATRHAVVTGIDPAVAISGKARELGAGLIVMGAYGQPLLREFFLGSATRTLLAESQVPLFLYH
jgi:nucleotide-binding universal stress UspA family protein